MSQCMEDLLQRLIWVISMYGRPFTEADPGTVIDLFAFDFILIRKIFWNLFLFWVAILYCKPVFFFTCTHIRIVPLLIFFLSDIVEHGQCIQTCLVLDWNRCDFIIFWVNLR